MADQKKSVKQRIIDAAWKLFYSKGYDDTTVDDIIELSGTSKGSFYYYFNGKDALLSTLSSILDDQYRLLKAAMPKEMNSFDKLMHINAEVHDFMGENIEYGLLASLYSSQLTTKNARHLLDQNRVYYKLVLSIIEEGQERGEITNDIIASEICHYYGLCERALVYDWCLNHGEYSLGDYSKKYMPIMMEHFKVK